MWGNSQEKLKVAREAAAEASGRGMSFEAHSIMLSAYITLLGGGRGGLYEKACFVYHLLYLYFYAADLNHKQLDILLQGMVRAKQAGRLPIGKPAIEKLADDALMKAIKVGLPGHELSLAYMTCAEVALLPPAHNTLALHHVRWALYEEHNILKEGELHALRQLVRIYRKAGEVHRALGEADRGNEYLKKALELAEGEGNTADQAAKIRKILNT